MEDSSSDSDCKPLKQHRTSRHSMDYLKSKDIRTFPHPAKSPDMSPIEHIWPALKEGIW